MSTATLNARQEITETSKFLTWLHETHGITVAELRQAHVDDYLAEGPSTRKHTRNFLHWHSYTHSRRRRVTTPYRKALTNPLLSEYDEDVLDGFGRG
jgi:hypothetical protein